jgi:hypothetical protein
LRNEKTARQNPGGFFVPSEAEYHQRKDNFMEIKNAIVASVL